MKFEAGRFWLDYYALRLPLGPRSTRPLLKRAEELIAEAPVELKSILTAIEHLPSSTETNPEKVAERRREKDVIRARLEKLCEETPAVREAIARALTELHDITDPASFDRLDALISNQPYRLSSWKVAAEEIKLPRFFDVNTLAAIRMELPEVFDATHKLLFELIGSGAVNGVRIDHIDGLANPREYLRNLQTGASGALGSPAEKLAIYLLVEKILAPGEKLRADWAVHGTTGYEFTNQVTELLVDRTAERALTDVYNRFVERQLGFQELVYRCKRLVMQVSMASEVNVLGHLLNRLSESHRWYRDFTVNALTAAVRETIACFRVYRTYLVPGEPPAEACVRVVSRALGEARRRNPALERTVFEFLRDVLLPPEPNPHPVDEALRQEFVLKFQQCTSPISAKGVEDTLSTSITGSSRSMKWAANPVNLARRWKHFTARMPRAWRNFRIPCWPPPRMTPSAAKTCARGSPCFPRCRRNGGRRCAAGIPEIKSTAARSMANGRPITTRRCCSTRRCSARGRWSRSMSIPVRSTCSGSRITW